MATSNIPRHVVLTGIPGVGKTTLVHKVCEQLRKNGTVIQGFYTEELRERGRRVGFDVVTLDGRRGPLSKIGDGEAGQKREYRVGQYVVQLQAFEQTALPTLRKQPGTHPVFIIDEVGKMELFSQSFTRAVRDLLDKPDNTVLATIPVPKGRPITVVEEIRNRKDTRLFQVTRDNRDSLLEDIVHTLTSSHTQYSSR